MRDSVDIAWWSPVPGTYHLGVVDCPAKKEVFGRYRAHVIRRITSIEQTRSYHLKVTRQSKGGIHMAVERRRHPRISISWPTIVQTRQGTIEAKSRDISEGGAFIEFAEELSVGDDFQIVFKPSQNRQISVTCEKAWCGNININGRETYSGMGVRFVKISGADRKLLSAFVSARLDAKDTD